MHGASSSSSKRHRRVSRNSVTKHNVLGFLSYLAALLVLVLVSRAEDRSPTPENSPQEAYLRIFSPDFWYEHAVGKPQPPAKYVAVIIVGQDMPKTIGQTSVSCAKEIPVACKRRVYLAQLLDALSDFAPKVVVLDMWFDPEACPDVESRDLWDELGRFSARVPVVSGLGSFNPSEILTAWPAEFADISNRQPSLMSTELVLKPRTHPTRAGKATTNEGVVELNSDNRKIPLSWPVYDSFATVSEPGQPRRVDSLSIVAVRAFDPKSKILKSVGALGPEDSPNASTQVHPYTSFLKEEDLPITRAIDVICSARGGDYSLSTCNSVEKRRLDPQTMFGGKIVLIGQAGVSGDVHASVVGNVPGVILQANYIESLLQNRIYKPLPKIWQLIIGIVWLAVVFWMSWRFISHPVQNIFFSLIAVIIPAYFIHLFILHFHYYTELLVQFILAAIILNITRWIDRFVTHREESLP
jgi:hypothetical protein